MPRYTVRQGEDLLQILRREAPHLRVEDVMRHPRNRALFVTRTASVLLPGDAIELPDGEPPSREVATNQSHRFRVRTRTRRLELVLRDEHGQPLGNAAYEIEVGGARRRGRTDDQGRLREEISLDATQATLRLGTRELPLRIGHLDPLQSVSGVQARLANLGFLVGEISGHYNGATAAALRAFQRRHQLLVTGHADPETLRRLRQEHGS